MLWTVTSEEELCRVGRASWGCSRGRRLTYYDHPTSPQAPGLAPWVRASDCCLDAKKESWAGSLELPVCFQRCVLVKAFLHSLDLGLLKCKMKNWTGNFFSSSSNSSSFARRTWARSRRNWVQELGLYLPGVSPWPGYLISQSCNFLTCRAGLTIISYLSDSWD